VVARDPGAGATAAGTRRLLVLGAGPAQLGLLEAARGYDDLFVIAADRDPAAPGLVLADRRALVSTEDEQGIAQLAEAERVDGIVSPGSDWPVGIAARVAARLGIAHPISPEAAVLATSKLRQRQRFAEAGVPQPRWKLVTEPDDELGFPCVVKAPDRQGQRGLSLVRSGAELAGAVAEAVAASRGGRCMVEELVEGPEVTVVAFSAAGRFRAAIVTDRLVADPPAFGVALAHVYPSEASDAAEAVATAQRAAEALGIEDGPTYTQLRIGPDGPQVVELAARLGGGHDAELAERVTGFAFNRATISVALGEEPPGIPIGGTFMFSPAAVTKFLVAPPGELRRVAGVDAASELDGIEYVLIYRRAGQTIEPLRRGPDRAGAILALGDTRDEALDRAEAAAALVEFEVADV
jgi:biotin carboxylase